VWRQFRPVFGFQAVATLVIALLAGWLAGPHGAISGVLGGLASMLAGLVLMVAKNKKRSAGEVLRDAMRAEAVKILLGFGFLWLVFKWYGNVVAAALIGAFCVTILIFGMAFFVKEAKPPQEVAK
jgi:ATP synthase protein I